LCQVFQNVDYFPPPVIGHVTRRMRSDCFRKRRMKVKRSKVKVRRSCNVVAKTSNISRKRYSVVEIHLSC